MNVKFRIGPSHPIPEITYFLVFGLKRLETKVMENHVFAKAIGWL